MAKGTARNQVRSVRVGVGAGAEPDVVDHHRGALAGEQPGVLAPDASARAGHDRHPSVESSHHQTL